MGLFESRSEKKEREHNEMQELGAEEGAIETFLIKATGADVLESVIMTEHEKKGLENGRRNKSKD